MSETDLCQEMNDGKRHDEYHIGDRIKRLRQELKLSQKDFAEAIGISRSRLSEIENGQPTKESVLIAISKTFGVSLEWLKTGRGEMWLKREEVYPVEVVAIPIITEVGAGGYRYTSDYVLIERSKLKAKSITAFKVRGDSMHPTIQDGEIVLLDEADKELYDGYVYLVATGEENGLKVRRLRLINNEWWLFCDNPNYPPEKLTQDMKIVGRAQMVYRPAEIRNL